MSTHGYQYITLIIISLIPYIVMGSGIIVLAAYGLRYRYHRYRSRHLYARRSILARQASHTGRESRIPRATFLNSTASMRAVVTLMILAAALYVLLFTEDEPQWAIGAIGSILGYWLPREP